MTLQFSLYEFIKIPRNFRLFRYIHERILEKGIYLCHPPPPSVKNKQIKTNQIELKKTTTTISKQNTNECVCGKMDGN